MSTWLPTAENINALPDGVRRFVMELETRVDPAGDLRARILAEDQVRQLSAALAGPPSERGERIVAAAIRENGVVYTAPHHAQIIRYLVPLLGIRTVKGEQGFVTSANRFVDRAEAARVAFLAEQTNVLSRSLFSEDLWIVPDYIFVPGSEPKEAA